MNYCEKIHYRIRSAHPAEFPQMVDDLLSQLSAGETILRLSFFGTPSSNKEYASHRALLQARVRRLFGDREPALSYVSQPPLNVPLVMEVHSYTPEADDRIAFKHYRQIPYVLLENRSGRFLFAGAFQGDVFAPGIERQSIDSFLLLRNPLLWAI